MSGTPGFVARNRYLILLLTAASVAVALVVIIWFQPQKLAIDEHVSEAAPTQAPRATRAAGPLARGEFRALEHSASGTATALRSGAKMFLRFEDFEVENGPDLFVYLSAADPDGPPRALADDFVDLGRLKGNVGDQNYAIPSGTDLERYDTVVIWCRRFTVAFALAELV